MDKRHDYTALSFIVTTPTQKQTRFQRRQIKKHAAKVCPPRQRPRKPRSRGPSKHNEHSRAVYRVLAPAEQKNLMPIYSYAPVLGLAMTITSGESVSSIPGPRSLHSVVKFFSLVSLEMYPKGLSIDLDDGKNDVYWIGTAFHDQVYLHAILALTGVFFDTHQVESHTPEPYKHSIKALQLLQDRLFVMKESECFSDATIMAIFALASTADIADDLPTVERHLRGLKRIIDIRGGMGSLRTNTPDLLGKICRLDLSLAVQTWRPPVFFNELTSWDPYLVISRTPQDADDETISWWITDNLEPRLRTIWEDLRQFRRMSIFANEANHKIPKDTFSELMVSLLYRLVNLSYDLDSPNEVVRLGMLGYVTSIFLRWGKTAEFHHLRRMLGGTLKAIHPGISDIPTPAILWLLITWHLLRPLEQEVGMLDGLLKSMSRNDTPLIWSEVQGLLRSSVWISHMHDVEGEAVYRRAILRMSSIE
uniref:Transcription factor domain-containing protein n=1 Tax=Bionectria ochroleuca TaxID=29856 RepID=A0A8H7K3R3_BIOOC